MPSESLRELLTCALERLGTVSAVSRELCGDTTKRPQISRILNGHDCGDMDKFERMVRRHFERRTCPHTSQEVAPAECTRRSTSPKPYGGRAREAHWMACQTCAHKEKS